MTAQIEFKSDIARLFAVEVSRLLGALPSDGHTILDMVKVNNSWLCSFEYISIPAHFSVAGEGATPSDAFCATRQVLSQQLREWYVTRFEPRRPIQTAHRRPPKALIVDDDIDTANAIDVIFREQGCLTEIFTRPEDIHWKLSSNRADFIILDWRLSDQIQGGQAVERATRLIRVFSDLQKNFSGARPKVITYSALPHSEIAFPVSDYFEHLDHWQKPLNYTDLVLRTSELLEGNILR